MRDSELMRVLLDDKKFKAKIDELRAQERKLAELQQIASTVAEANAMLIKADGAWLEVVAEKKAISEREQVKIKELNDQAKAHQLAVDQKASQQQDQHKQIRQMLDETKMLKSENELVRTELNQHRYRLLDWEKDLSAKEKQLQDKIKRVNEAWGN